MRWHGVLACALTAVLASCGPPATEDPCAPGGHVHRDPAGDWCHCDRGHRTTADGLACEVDPSFRETLELADSDARACWHSAHGPFATIEDGGLVDAFLVYFTVNLTPRADGRFEGVVRYQPAASGAHVVSLDVGGPLRVSEQEKTVPFVVTRSSTLCPGVRQQWAAVLESRVSYALHLGPLSQPRVQLLIDWLE